MNAAVVQNGIGGSNDTWSWWQSRRLSYNLAIAGAGAASYATSLALHYTFGNAPFASASEAISQTIFLGTMYLVVMGLANLCYLLGPFAEMVLRRADPERYRRTAYAMGFWFSVGAPFLFTLLTIGFLVGDNGQPFAF
jgi:hypothetical protein